MGAACILSWLPSAPIWKGLAFERGARTDVDVAKLTEFFSTLRSVLEYRAVVVEAFREMRHFTVSNSVLSARELLLLLLHKWSLVSKDLRLQEDLQALAQKCQNKELLNSAERLSCPVLLVVGDNSPHEDAVVECNTKLDPTQTSFLKMADGGGQPRIAQTSRLTEAIKNFLQGMGYMATSAMTRLSRSRTGSITVGEGERGRSRTLSRGSTGGGAAPPPVSP